MRTPLILATVITIVAGAAVLISPPHSSRSDSDSQSSLDQPSAKRDARILPDSAVRPANTYSNILPDDYVGPKACANCHKKQYQAWQSHPHSCMNQLPNATSVKSDFDNAVLTMACGEVQFTTEGEGEYWMTVRVNNEITRRYVVTRTVGSRCMQFFVGKQTIGPEPTGHAIYDEHMLPFAYWFQLGRWMPREFLDANGPEKLNGEIPLIEAVNTPPDVRSYTAVCMNCHNTFPYAYRIFHRNFAGFLDATVAAAIGPLSKALSHHTPVEPTVADFKRVNSRLNPDQDLVSLGISCESCHFGGREHVAHQKKVSFVPSSCYVDVRSHDPHRPVTSDRHNPATVLGICVQCHSGNGDFYANGAAKSNSREAIDMYLGACKSQLRCVDCHEPHTASPRPGGPDNPLHIAQCVRCHEKYASSEAAVAHAGFTHGNKVSCLDCHMPRCAQGLEGLVRSHKISVPVEESMVATGAVNACNLCHLDKSLNWTLKTLESGWGRRIEPKQDWPSLSQLDVPSGELWIHNPDPSLRIVATQSYAASPLGKSHLAEILESFSDPQPINRLFASFAACKILQRPLNEPLEFDFTAGPRERHKRIDALKIELLEKSASP